MRYCWGADILPLLSVTASLVIAAVYLLKWDKYMVGKQSRCDHHLALCYRPSRLISSLAFFVMYVV